MHPLDLPVVARRPSADELQRVLTSLTVTYRNHDTPAPLDPGVTQWLTRIVASDLEWIPEPDATSLREQAASRIAQEGGVSARSNVLREIDVSPELVLKLHEPGLTEDNLGFTTWGSSLVLSKRLWQNPELLVGSVLELGSGTGLCGITAAKLDHTVVLTDLAEIVPNVQRNIELNEVTNKAQARELDWTKPHTEEATTIVVSDPVYSSDHPRWLLGAISATKSLHRVVLQFPLRPGWEKERQQVCDGLTELGFTQVSSAEEQGHDDFGTMDYAFSLWTR